MVDAPSGALSAYAENGGRKKVLRAVKEAEAAATEAFACHWHAVDDPLYDLKKLTGLKAAMQASRYIATHAFTVVESRCWHRGVHTEGMAGCACGLTVEEGSAICTAEAEWQLKKLKKLTCGG